VGAKPDGYALAVGNGRGALQRIVGNIKGENIGFGLTGYTARHDAHPIKAFTGEPIHTVPLYVPPCPASHCIWIKLLAAARTPQKRADIDLHN